MGDFSIPKVLSNDKIVETELLQYLTDWVEFSCVPTDDPYTQQHHQQALTWIGSEYVIATENIIIQLQ